MENKRTKTWATIVYSESAPPNWIEILKEQHIPAFVSPKHDKDLTDDGTLKKEHYHVMLLFEGLKSVEQAKEVFEKIGGVGVELVNCTRAYARYLCHLDNPDKVQYDANEVISIAGADYTEMLNTPPNTYTIIAEIIEYCQQNDIDSYAYILLYAKNNRSDWFKVLCDSGTLLIVQFLKSKHWEEHRDDKYNRYSPLQKTDSLPMEE